MLVQLWQTLVLALVQGVTELFPISSLGHTVIIGFSRLGRLSEQSSVCTYGYCPAPGHQYRAAYLFLA